jgi:hypothetical protein
MVLQHHNNLSGSNLTIFKKYKKEKMKPGCYVLFSLIPHQIVHKKDAVEITAVSLLNLLTDNL